MPKPKLSLNSADEVRDKITERQVREIRKMFADMAKEVAKKAKQLEGKDNISSIIKKRYLEDLAKELKKQLNANFKELKKAIESDMKDVSESVIDCVKEFEAKTGIPIKDAWLNVPIDAVMTVSSGNLYAGNWTLSSRIWGTEQKVLKDINAVIAKGIAENMSAYDIAKDLEKYVDPKAKKDWNWSKVYPGTNRRIDYNAQRLARTMVSHAYQFSFVESTKDNPFITKYQWVSSHDKRVCPICKERDGKLFDKDKLPLDHPNGRCTHVAVFEQSMMDISDQLADWVKSPEGTNPAIDNYMKKRFGTDRFEKAMKMAQQGAEQNATKGEGKVSLKSLSKPVRPKKRNFESEEAYENAKEAYYKAKEEYNKQLELWAEQQLGNDEISFDELVKWGEKNSVTIDESVKNVDGRVLYKWTKRYEKLIADFPEVSDLYRSINRNFTVSFENTLDFFAESSRGMTFGGSFTNGFESIVSHGDNIVSGFLVQSDSIDSLFDHEFGHNVYAAIRYNVLTSTEERIKLKDDLISSVYGKDGMSEYSTINDDELFAEAFSAWYSGEKTEFSKAFGKLLERWMK